MKITAKKVLKYTLLPGFRPRIGELFFSGFRYIPFFIALVYQMTRLLPAGHPYANPGNIGRFGIRHVIAEAAGNLRWDKRNIDQILLFGLILVALTIVALQIGLLVFFMLAQPVSAAVATMPSMPTTFQGFFVTEKPQQDVAHILLDMVFGVPGVFNSCIAQQIPCTGLKNNAAINLGLPWPWPAHQGLHAMFEMYSIGLLLVAVLITCYFIATILLETAQTGTPFGKRFNKVWAPVRLVVAFGLLVPVGVGMNSAQYITLYAAKYGSAFATNGWLLFNQALDASNINNRKTLLEPTELVSKPKVPEVGGLLQFLFVARTCAELAQFDKNFETDRTRLNISPNAKPADQLVQPYFVKDSLAAASFVKMPASYDRIIRFADGSKQLTLRFGFPSENAADEKGSIKQVCGQLNIPLSDARPPHVPNDPKTAEMGAEVMQRYYLFVIEELWFDVFTGNPPTSYAIWTANYQGKNFPLAYAKNYTGTATGAAQNNPQGGATGLPEPDTNYSRILQEFYDMDLKNALENPTNTGLGGILGSQNGAIWEMENSTSWGMSQALKDKGWAAAGIWYNRIADLNGAITAASLSIPTPTYYPQLMELVKQQKRQQDQNLPISTQFHPRFNFEENLRPNNFGDINAANAMWQAFNYWQTTSTTSTHTTESSNAFINVVNALFGTSGLYSMRDNAYVHPLAKLVGLGRSLIEASIRNIGWSVGISLGTGVVSFISNNPVPLIPTMISFVFSITIITLTLGFILYYVLPFLPFIYFFFSVGGWVKAIFEAMVGMPLWALAHIRIDKDGLSGQAARGGYFLMLEIFMRPILIVFGLLASISVFAAIVSSLDQTWDLIVYNAGGFDVESNINTGSSTALNFFRSAVDEFFYTIIYTILVYMMGMASFKLIDLIPNNIMRWMGESVQPYNDQREDAAESLMGTAYIGSQQAFSQIGSKMGGAMETLGKLKRS